MATVITVGSLVLLVVACLAGLVALVFGLPGTFLILGAAFLYAWSTGFTAVGWATLGWLSLLAILGEILELLLGSGVGGTVRPSRRVAVAAIVGSIVGGLVGAPLLLGLGALIGALIGAFAGAGLAASSEGHSLADSAAHGWQALKGRFAGFVVKSAIGVGMSLLVLIDALRGAPA